MEMDDEIFSISVRLYMKLIALTKDFKEENQ